mgnify:CR=1 FL=1
MQNGFRLFGRLYLKLVLLTLAVETLVRIVLLFNEQTTDLGFTFGEWLQVFLLGALNDLAVATLAFAFLWLYTLSVGSGKFRSPWGYLLLAILAGTFCYVTFGHTVFDEYGSVVPAIASGLLGYWTASFALRLFVPSIRKGWSQTWLAILLVIYVGLILFNGLCEYFFWNEFGVRYNFIAVDYLVYTNEVVGNIMESYPVVPMLAVLLAVTLVAAWLLFRHDVKCTDLLRGVITSIRKEIESLGGEVHFNTALTGFERRDGQLVGIQTTDGAFPCEALVFAVGHSARDTFGMLMDSGLVLECKPFSVGFRAEHLQSEIEKSLYHEAAGHPALPRGEYQLSQHVEKRCVYTFCMCPGGQVVASASEKGRVVTNGMSYHARSGKNANAAVVVSVGGADFANDPRRAIAFQRELEAKAYAAGRAAGAYAAPAENVQSFLEGRGQLHIGSVQPTYDRGVTAADLGALLPGELADTLRAGLRAYERKIAGYTAPDAILTGLETRTSSPVRLKREEDFVCTQLAGLYPCGEGAGYAGGIMSAAVDGLRVARAIISRYAPAEG